MGPSGLEPGDGEKNRSACGSSRNRESGWQRVELVVYTRRGSRLLAKLEEIMGEVTAELAAEVGKRRFEQFCSVLAERDTAANGEDAPLRLLDILRAGRTTHGDRTGRRRPRGATPPKETSR